MRWFVFSLLPLLMAFDTQLEDSAQEQRARNLMEEIRCVACENEPISQSNADIAEDMRARVREMIAEGASDAEVRDWFADRYGEFVLFRPSTQGAAGLVLWAVPFGLLVFAGIGLGLARRRRGGQAAIEAVPPETFDQQTLDQQTLAPKDPDQSTQA